MGGERRSATSTLSERVTRGVEAEFRAAAEARWEPPPEVFLWRARRCVEAMVYALLVEVGADVMSLAEKPLEELCRHEKLRGVIPRGERDHVESLRKYANTGTHFQVEGAASETSAGIAASALSALMRWYYERRGETLAPAVLASLAALDDRRRRLVPPMEVERDAALAQAAALAQRMENASTARVSTPSVSGADGRVRRSRDIGRIARWGLVGVSLAAVSFALGHWMLDSVSTSAAPSPIVVTDPPDPPPVTPSAAPPAEVSPPPSVVTHDAVAAPPSASEAATPLRCDPGMHLVPSTGGALPFCIDDQLVTTAAYQSCVDADAGGCTQAGRTLSCNLPNHSVLKHRPANCVSLDDARQYCAWRHPGRGRLPSQQDLQARHGTWFQQAPMTSEWSDTELSPPGRVWILAGPGGVRAPQAPSTRSSGVGFRCVVR